MQRLLLQSADMQQIIQPHWSYIQDDSQERIPKEVARDLTLVTFKSQPEIIHMILRY